MTTQAPIGSAAVMSLLCSDVTGGHGGGPSVRKGQHGRGRTIPQQLTGRESSSAAAEDAAAGRLGPRPAAADTN